MDAEAVHAIKEAAFALVFVLGMAGFVYAWVIAARRAWHWFENLEWDEGHRPEDRARDAVADERARTERQWP